MSLLHRRTSAASFLARLRLRILVPRMTSTLHSLYSAIPWLETTVLLLVAYILVKSPLARVPGPRFSTLNVLWTNFQQLYTEDPAIALDLHKQYGPIVRIGPSEVWVSGVTMIRKILGSYQFSKSFHYEAFRTEGNSLFTTNDPDSHRLQKRLMLPAYTINSLNELEPLIYNVGVRQLVERVGRHADAGDTIDMMDLFQRLAFEIIGEVSFGKSLELFDEKKPQHPIMKWINGATTYSALKMLLIEAVDEDTGASMSNEDLVAQSIMLMVAGTDTTACTLTWTLLLLVEHPECAQRLVKEIQALNLDPASKPSYDVLQSLPYLDAVINESMRVRPIAPHGMPRV
ncbi:cytochrome P450, partial [Syncephalis pseudoplumigaleata]